MQPRRQHGGRHREREGRGRMQRGSSSTSEATKAVKPSCPSTKPRSSSAVARGPWRGSVNAGSTLPVIGSGEQHAAEAAGIVAAPWITPAATATAVPRRHHSSLGGTTRGRGRHRQRAATRARRRPR